MTPSELFTKEYMEALIREAELSEKEIESLFSDAFKVLVALYLSGPKSSGFNFKLPKSADLIFAELRKNVREVFDKYSQKSAKLSALKNSTILNKKIDAPELKGWLDRVIQDRTLNQRILRVTNAFKMEVEARIAIGIVNGESEYSMIRSVEKFLLNPYDFLSIDKRLDYDARRLAIKYSPKTGTYKTAYANAKRLIRSEVFEAYRRSDHLIWKASDKVKGVLVYLNPLHPQYDSCDELVGLYPKDFFFTGFHPACYSDDTEVYTDSGWKLFKNVLVSDKILSLNKETYDLEYSNIIMKFEREFNGNMVNFHNISLDMLVTPDHDMIYINKSNGRTFESKKASDYKKTNGPLYRSSEWTGIEIEDKKIGNSVLDFDIFCEFMGYWLADGCIVSKRPYAITISAQEDKDFENRSRIEECVSLITEGNYTSTFSGIHFHNKDFYNYLNQFGKALDKFIPNEIKESSPRQIKIFLDAFISCDGSVRKRNHSFANNKNKNVNLKSEDRIYFTSSEKMAGDIGELILKIGKRPSFYTSKTKGKLHKFKNGIYKINADGMRISECKSKTSSAFYKDEIPYNGMVYDLEIDKNHTLFVRRNGKCSWGSNCICLSRPYVRGDLVKNIPDTAKDYMSQEKTQKWYGKLPFINQNTKYWKI